MEDLEDPQERALFHEGRDDPELVLDAEAAVAV